LEWEDVSPPLRGTHWQKMWITKNMQATSNPRAYPIEQEIHQRGIVDGLNILPCPVVPRPILNSTLCRHGSCRFLTRRNWRWIHRKYAILRKLRRGLRRRYHIVRVGRRRRRRRESRWIPHFTATPRAHHRNSVQIATTDWWCCRLCGYGGYIGQAPDGCPPPSHSSDFTIPYTQPAQNNLHPCHIRKPWQSHTKPKPNPNPIQEHAKH
jgi:hypothetical protein